MKYLAFLLLVVVIATGCSSKQQAAQVHEKAHEKDTISKTVWTAKIELFMEYDEPNPGQKTEVLIHLTNLKDFKPISEGPLTLSFAPRQGEPVTVIVDKPARPGIFKVDVTFNQPGVHTLTASLKGKALSDKIIVPGIRVIGGEEKHHEHEHHDEHEHHEAHGERSEGDISFLKEQQWTVDFMVGLPVRQRIFSSFVATGEVIPVAHAEAILSSPLSGILSLSRRLPHIGKRVTEGEVLAVIEPPISPQGGIGSLTASYAEAKNRVILAEKEHERAKRLFGARAVPERRLEEAELGLESAKAAFEPLKRAVSEMKQVASDSKVVIKAPFSGTVVELLTTNGKSIDAGQSVLRLINTSLVWLRANMPVTEISGLKNIDKAAFTIPGIDGELKPSHLVAVSSVVDSSTRTVPVIYEVNNSSGRLKIGMFADVSIKTGSVENALTLPDEAVFEDEGRFFVFVQLAGELFERREVKTGIRGKGYVQIVEGIKEGERIVTKGGYYAKLASMSARMPQGHGHDH